MSFLRAVGEVIGFLVLSLMAIVEGIVKLFIPRKYRMKSVAGEIALVTGGGGGLGRLLSLRLADLGAIVVVWDINEKGIEETVKLVQSAGGTCYGYVCNLCNRQDVYKKAAITRQEVGKSQQTVQESKVTSSLQTYAHNNDITKAYEAVMLRHNVTILINNAGVVMGKHFLDTPDEDIIRTMDVNIMSHFWTVKAFLPAMIEDNKGHIVSIASLAGHCGISKLVDYCASKFAAVGFDEALRMELEAAGYNIHTTVICPYFIRSTGMFEDVQSRFVPTLLSNDVADKVISAMRCNEKYVIVPNYLQVMIAAKWMFPWPCVAMFLRGLVRDASPEHEAKTASSLMSGDLASEQSKDQNGVGLHQQLARRVSSSERKP